MRDRNPRRRRGKVRRTSDDEARRRSALLADIGAVVAERLDVEESVKRIAGLVVSSFADWCAVDVLEDGAIRRLHVTHADPGRAADAAEAARRYPPDQHAPYGPADAIRQGKPRLYPEISDPMLVASARDAEHLELLRRAGLVSGMCVPLVARGTVLGALSLASSAPNRRYGEADLAFAEQIAHRLALDIHNDRLFAEVERERRELNVVGELARSIISSLEPETVLQRIADGAKELCDADFTAIFLREPATGAMVPHYRAGDQQSAFGSVRVEPGQGVGGLVLRTRQPFRTDDYLTDPRVPGDYRAVAAQEGVVALMVVPIVLDEHVEGLLYVGRHSPRPFTARDEAICLRLADQTAVAVRNSRLFAAERAARAEAEALHRIGRRVAAELDLQALVQAITDAGRELSGAAYGALFYNVVNEQGEAYMLYALAGAPREAFADFPLPRNTALFEPTFRGEGIVRLDDVHADPRYGKASPHFGMPPGHLPVRSYVAVPVVSRTGDVLGGLFFGHPEPGRFTEHHERLLGGLAAQAAVAMDNARLFKAASEAREAAEAANRAKDVFLAMLSHELRTPLTAMLGYVRMLRSGMLQPSDVERALETIERNTRLQAKLIDDLLDVSRIVSGKLVLTAKPVHLVGVLHSALDAVRAAAQAKDIAVEMTLAAGTETVWGDEARLEQIVWNLLSNAVKFTPPGGRVEVRLDRVDDRVHVVVSDSGKGIAPELLPYIFDRFRQADAPAARAEGLGLGLTIARHLVEQHGGTIEAHSAGPDQGATFTVTLPLRELGARAAPPRADAAAEGEALPSLEGVHVLLVEDNADVREMFAAVLRRCGADVTAAPSVADALAALEGTTVGAILADISLPGRDGYELIGELRARLPSGATIPAIAVTANARAEDHERALAAGYDLHIAKPIEPVELCRVLARVTGRAP